MRAFVVAAMVGLMCAPAVAAQGQGARKKAKARKRPNPAFVKVTDDPALPRVLLIGDSISIGYTVSTRKLLSGQANVHRIPENGGPTSRGLVQLDKWLGDCKWDVIHFNWGLHDLKFMPDGKRQVPLEQYEKNLSELVRRLKATGARLIWASTTPVPVGEMKPKRQDGDVVRYNAVAAKIMAANGIAIDDLYAFALPRLEKIQRPVNVHFTPRGSAVLAKEVAASIRVALAASGRAAVGADYLQVVRAFADVMIREGRDSYGDVYSPLFAAALDRKTLKLPSGAPPDIPGIRKNDRTLTGANPMHDLNLYQMLYGLTKITGDARYAAAADETLAWFFKHCQSPATGLFAWGEHLGWDFEREAPPAGRDTHEFYRPWVLWNRAFDLAPEAAQRFAMGVWRHQISDHEKGLYSRHASYAKHKPGRGTEYPRHGGFYIATWAAAYERSKAPKLLEAIETLVGSYEARRNKQSGAIPAYTGLPEQLWPASNLSLAVDLWDCAEVVPAELADKMRACGSRTDEVYLKMAHDLSPGACGFITFGLTSTLEPGDPRKGKRRHFTDTWATGYGEATDAQLALLCLMRYRQVKLQKYEELALAAGERYLKSEPNTSIALYPGSMGDAVALMLALHRLTGDAKYLDRAEHFGKRAVEIFFDGSPLPRASSEHDHYEAITRADLLAMELLDLWAIRNRPKLDLGFVYPER